MFLAIAASLLLPALSGFGSPAEARPERVPGEMLVTCRAGRTDAECRAALEACGRTVLRRLRFAAEPASVHNRRYLVRAPAGADLERALESVRGLPDVEAAQPNFLYRPLAPPDDPYYSLQWGLENTGDDSPHTLFGLRGPDPRAPDADMDDEAARDLLSSWTITPVVVGVIDTGADLRHPDLMAMLWTNPGEVPGNGADDDGNGYADDVHGWDFAGSDADPTDEDGHGTHVAGTVGASSDNATGVAGVASNGRLMILRFLDESGGSTSDVVEAILYGVGNGARVLNAGWGGGPFDPALYDAIVTAHDYGVVFVAAAGNDHGDNDDTPNYPSSYDVENVVSVAASTAWRDLADFSNWGAQSVDVAAPGDEIISTNPVYGASGVPETAYQIAMPSEFAAYRPWSGTSMATPAVAAAAAIVFGAGEILWPDLWDGMSAVERMNAVIDRLLARAERWPSLGGLVATGGHLNLRNLLEDDGVPPEPCGPSLRVADKGPDFVTLRWTATGDDGQTGRANYYDLRYQQGAPLDFASATRVEDVWTPGPPGAPEAYTFTGLLPGTEYSFGLEVVDNVGNRSALAEIGATTHPVPVLFSDDMEAGPDGWTAMAPWALTDEASASPVHCWTDSPGGLYDPDLDVSLTSPEIVTGGSSAELAFLQRYDLGTGADQGSVETRSSEDGIWGAWSPVLVVAGTDPVWRPVAASLPAGGDSIQIRFRLRTDTLDPHDGWYVDDVVVREAASPVLLPMFEDTFDGDDCSGWLLAGGWGCESNALSDSVGGDYPLNYRASAAVGPLDFEGLATVRASFEIVAFAYEADHDFLFFQFSLDGASWRTLERYTGSALGTRSFDLDGLAGAPSVRFRFLSVSDHGIAADGARIDDFRIEVAEAVGCVSDDECDDGDDCTADACDLFTGACVRTPVVEDPPPEVPALSVEGSTLSWVPVAGARGYDVVSGDLAGLPGLGIAATVIGCLAESEPSTSVTDASALLPGEGRWYVVRGENCGGTSSYGAGYLPLLPTRDEAIAASGLGCLP